jgi:hypothetical protein
VKTPVLKFCADCAAKHRAGQTGKCLSCWIADSEVLERQLIDDVPPRPTIGWIVLFVLLCLTIPTAILAGVDALGHQAHRIGGCK